MTSNTPAQCCSQDTVVRPALYNYIWLVLYLGLLQSYLYRLWALYHSLYPLVRLR